LLRDRVHAAAEAWAEDWLPAGGALSTECIPAAGTAGRFQDASWTRISAGAGEEWLCLADGGSAAHTLGAALFGAPAGGSAICAAAAQAGVLDLAERILGGSSGVQPSLKRRTGPSAAPPASLWLPGSAGMAVGVRAGQLDLRFLAAPAWTLRRLRELPAAPQARPQPVALRDAVRGAACELRVMAGTARLELREIGRLRPGDVIALGRHVEGAMGVELHGRVLLEARLGSMRGRRAVALAAES
jgi:hypothetical protein